MRVQVLREVPKTGKRGRPRLCLQFCRYAYGNGVVEHGYRFIWRKRDGGMQPARGQARIPSVAAMERLVAEARAEGWGELDGDAAEGGEDAGLFDYTEAELQAFWEMADALEGQDKDKVRCVERKGGYVIKRDLYNADRVGGWRVENGRPVPTHRVKLDKIIEKAGGE